MKSIIKSVIGLLLMVSSALSAASPADEARVALEQAGVDVVENLVAIGKPSPEAAADVMVVVALDQPVLLREVMSGLAEVMSPEAFEEAVQLAAKALADINEPEPRRLILQIASEISVRLRMREGDVPGGSIDRVGEDATASPS